MLIVDIGGGTSDFAGSSWRRSGIGCTTGATIFLANAGIHISGTDFDRLLSLREVMPLLGMGGRMGKNTEVPANYYHLLSTWHTINFLYERKLRRELDDVLAEVGRPHWFRLRTSSMTAPATCWRLRSRRQKIGCCVEGHGRLQLDMPGRPGKYRWRWGSSKQRSTEAIGKIAGTVANLCADAGVRPWRNRHIVRNWRRQRRTTADAGHPHPGAGGADWWKATASAASALVSPWRHNACSAPGGQLIAAPACGYDTCSAASRCRTVIH